MNVTNINNYNTHQQKLFGSPQLFLGVYRVLWQKKKFETVFRGYRGNGSEAVDEWGIESEKRCTELYNDEDSEHCG